MEPRREHFLSITQGGPTYRLVTRLRRRYPKLVVRAWWLPLAIWFPIVLGEVVRVVLGMPLDPMVLDLSMHVRVLVTLPLIVAAEPLLEQTVRSGTTSIYKGSFCDHVALEAIFDRAERLRDSRFAEALLLGLAVLGGQLVLWRVFGSTGLFHGGAAETFWSFPRVWYAVVALPLVQFVMFRWLWRWIIWIYVLARIARLPLIVLSTHPDYAGGLTGLARPGTAFSGFLLGISSLLAAAWGTQILQHRATLTDFIPGVVAFLVVSLIFAVGPLLMFCGHLFRNRRRTLALYGDFARKYMQGFHEKWITPGDRIQPLGTPDIQSLNDLGSAFQVIAKTRVFVFGPRNVFAVWFAGLLPMVPLFASVLTVEVVLKKIFSTVLGGIPI